MEASVAPVASIPKAERRHFDWLDIVWFVFLVGLAVLPPRGEWHKQVILLAIGILQVLEGTLIRYIPRRGPAYVVVLKILLATLLIDHTGEIGINSRYYPIYYLPVVTAALYFGPWGTLGWTLLTSAAYCSFLYPALQEYELTDAGIAQLALRISFFFLAAMLVNRFEDHPDGRVAHLLAVVPQQAHPAFRLEESVFDDHTARADVGPAVQRLAVKELFPLRARQRSRHRQKKNEMFHREMVRRLRFYSAGASKRSMAFRKPPVFHAP